MARWFLGAQALSRVWTVLVDYIIEGDVPELHANIHVIIQLSVFESKQVLFLAMVVIQVACCELTVL